MSATGGGEPEAEAADGPDAADVVAEYTVAEERVTAAIESLEGEDAADPWMLLLLRAVNTGDLERAYAAAKLKEGLAGCDPDRFRAVAETTVFTEAFLAAADAGEPRFALDLWMWAAGINERAYPGDREALRRALEGRESMDRAAQRGADPDSDTDDPATGEEQGGDA